MNYEHLKKDLKDSKAKVCVCSLCGYVSTDTMPEDDMEMHFHDHHGVPLEILEKWEGEEE
tara:strand:+ start:1074 stop:1253 length:180 start_codon:yes stop_codon:yes gene_type:complete